MTGDRALFGWRVRSELDLPELLPWLGDDRLPDINISLAAIPGSTTKQLPRRPPVDVAPGGGVRFTVPRVAAYLVEEGGSQITIDPVLQPEAPDIRVFLFGTVLGIVCYQRGVLPLHAAAVEIGGRAILLAGPSGSGKSTLAAALGSRGHRVLADDVCVVRREDDGSLAVHPSSLRLRLWRDTLEALGLSPVGLERSRPGLEKYHLPFEPGNGAAAPPGALLFLDRGVAPAAITTQVVRGYATLQSQAALVYRYSLGLKLGAHAAVFGLYTTLVETAGLTHLSHPNSFSGLAALAMAVEDIAAGA